jgi:hypothetical protein
MLKIVVVVVAVAVAVDVAVGVVADAVVVVVVVVAAVAAGCVAVSCCCCCCYSYFQDHWFVYDWKTNPRRGSYMQWHYHLPWNPSWVLAVGLVPVRKHNFSQSYHHHHHQLNQLRFV